MRPIAKAFLIFIFFVFLPHLLAQPQRQDFWLEMDDGVKLDVTRFTLAGSMPVGGFPAVVFVHGLGGSKSSMINKAASYAGDGYVTVTYSVRGQGKSEGLTTVFSYREQADLDSIINWLAAYVVVNDTLIGISGGSQGGYHSWLAAVRGMNVRAVAPENSTPNREDAAARYGCYSKAITAELEYRQGVRIDTVEFPLKRWLLSDNYDSVRAIIARGRHFDADDVAASTAHYLMMGAYHDHVFPHNRVTDAFVAAPKSSTMYLGVIGHSSGNSRTEAEFREDLLRRFLGETLKGEDSGLASIGPVVTALGPDWNHCEFDAWPPESQENLTYYLHADGTLSSTVPGQTDSSWHMQHRLQESAYTWTEAVNEGFRNANNRFLRNRFSWVSAPLSDTLRVLGIPTAHVNARGTAARFQINLQLYAQSPQGQPTYLTQISLGKRANPNPDQWHELSGEFTIVGWEIPPDYRLRIDWVSINETLEHENLWTIPYWDANGTLTLGLDGQNPTVITIPVLNGQATGIRDGEKYTFQNRLIDFQLTQNHPNPFNLSTAISYQLSAFSKITLSILNILGQKVRTLVNEEKPAGPYSVIWDGFDEAGQPLDSGIYFYTLTCDGKVTQSRKMCLMK